MSIYWGFDQLPQDPFYRVETPTQTKADAKLQANSGEIWGRPARGSGQPSVKAYPGHLPSIIRGIEFTTAIDPQQGSAPNEARWYWGWTQGVELRQKSGTNYACITITSFKNCQP
jgi:hypothetical protein